jgi:2-polyprenyl-3-methyl-5-hydroxy-6-metoxy-1,4-benzoquinol methylase
MSKCPVCTTSAPFWLEKDGHPLARCPECGLVFMDPLPPAGFLREQVYSPASGYHAELAEDPAALPRPAWWDRMLRLVQQATPGRRLLEVGCSHGALLFHARALGYSVKGVELNPATAAIARRHGLEVVIGTLEEARLAAGTFDVIWLGDVLEHVPDPRGLLLLCRELLDTGGVLALSTPNLDCAWGVLTTGLHRRLGLPASTVTPPHHTFQFSEGNLRQLLAQTGFAVRHRWFRPPLSLAYELQATHLVRAWRRTRTPGSLVRLLAGTVIYPAGYGLCRVLAMVRRRDFSLQVLAGKADAGAAGTG